MLDATKLIPEELVPVQPIGRLVMNRNPDHFFALLKGALASFVDALTRHRHFERETDPPRV